MTLRPKTSRRPVVTGLLRTVEGKPLSGTVVDVHEAPRTASHYRRVGSLRTDAAGRFRYAIPAGASRTIRFTYEGSPTVAPSQASIVVRSPAGSTIRVDRRRARNGQAVRFTGRLTGRPVPTAGKVVELQAKVGRRWVTFRTLRSKSTGIWRASYRFRSTTGVKTYQFRAFLRREADYPYEAGRSGVVRVTVRGR